MLYRFEKTGASYMETCSLQVLKTIHTCIELKLYKSEVDGQEEGRMFSRRLLLDCFVQQLCELVEGIVPLTIQAALLHIVRGCVEKDISRWVHCSWSI